MVGIAAAIDVVTRGAELRRQTSRELNKGETPNSLARAVFIHRLREIRDRTYENQQHRASGLNLLVTAIILWNTLYLERAVAALSYAGHLAMF
jgi:TnpA family transposase